MVFKKSVLLLVMVVANLSAERDQLKVQYSQKETPGLNLVFNQFGQILAKFTCKPNATKFANWL